MLCARSYQPLIKDTFTEKPDWDSAVKKNVVSRIGEGTKQFLQYTGRPRDY